VIWLSLYQISALPQAIHAHAADRNAYAAFLSAAQKMTGAGHMGRGRCIFSA